MLIVQFIKLHGWRWHVTPRGLGEEPTFTEDVNEELTGALTVKDLTSTEDLTEEHARARTRIY